jgi:hypothetical protein
MIAHTQETALRVEPGAVSCIDNALEAVRSMLSIIAYFRKIATLSLRPYRCRLCGKGSMTGQGQLLP